MVVFLTGCWLAALSWSFGAAVIITWRVPPVGIGAFVLLFAMAQRILKLTEIAEDDDET